MNSEIIVPELNSDTINSMIYEIRGVKVMLDFDLAKIYGYETKRFNEQVKNNIEKFPERYRFQLTKDEIESISRSKKSTMNKSEKRRGHNIKYYPYAFTEQGIYMLMTVLKGELATKQSIILIDTFKRMKDYLIESNTISSINELIKLIYKQNESFVKKDEFEIVKRDLALIMDKFINDSNNYLFFNNERIDADLFFQNAFKKAKHTVYIIDDYIDVKTLYLLKSCNSKVKIIVFTDNKGINNLNKIFIDDFKKDSSLNILFKENRELHDRLLIVDFNYKNEIIYHLGQSIKDCGNSSGGIDEIKDKENYRELITKMLINNKYLELL